MNDLVTLFTTLLDSAGVDYVVTGGTASAIYGEPRPTQHVDLVVVLEDASIDALVGLLPETEFHRAPPEVIRLEAHRSQRGHFAVIHRGTGFTATLYLVGRDPLHRWAFTHRRRVAFGSTTLCIAPPEYVIVRKLESYREGGDEKHLEDIRGMLVRSADEIDDAELGQRIAALGLAAAWAAVCAQ